MKTEIRVIDLSDKDLLDLAKKYGSNAKEWLRKFAGLLPEIFKRSLYKKEGFVSIHQYAKMVAGMNEATVDRVLNLRQKLDGKPTLLSLFESGIEGWSKLEKVVSIATSENDRELAEVVKISSAKTLDAYVKGKKSYTFDVEELKHDGVISQIYSYYPFRLSIDVMRKLRWVKQKFEKQKKQNLSWNEAFRYWAFASQSEKIELTVCVDCARRSGLKAKTRAIPMIVRRFVRAKFGDGCPVSGCNQPWTHFHHKKRFAIFKSHDPDFIIPLCKIHHDLVHEGLVANEDDPPWKWYFRDQPEFSNIDKKVQQYKYKA